MASREICYYKSRLLSRDLDSALESHRRRDDCVKRETRWWRVCCARPTYRRRRSLAISSKVLSKQAEMDCLRQGSPSDIAEPRVSPIDRETNNKIAPSRDPQGDRRHFSLTVFTTYFSKHRRLQYPANRFSPSFSQQNSRSSPRRYLIIAKTPRKYADFTRFTPHENPFNSFLFARSSTRIRFFFTGNYRYVEKKIVERRHWKILDSRRRYKGVAPTKLESKASATLGMLT